MKQLLFILLFPTLLGSSFSGYSQKRVLMHELQVKTSFIYYESKLFNGIGYSVYENGKLSEEISYQEGKKEGLNTEWYDNGIPRLKQHWRDGLMQGKVIGWYENGEKEYIGQYESYDWYDSWEWRDAKEKVGLWKYYHENGQLKEEKNFKEGVEMKK